ncbi:MAG TPA: response regulator [Planctomycetota bacterium]|jgi:two-component system KDP operon response regulator KdpE|nr:response regulator [Planctomycetota bacterium]
MPESVILVIEDEAPIVRFLRTVLTPPVYKLEEATTGQEGLSRAASLKPDLILLDLGLPDMDGLEVLKRLREWTPLPVIIVSARGQEKDKIAGLDAGADDYLTKPFNTGELLARIRACLRRTQSADGEGAEPIFTLGDLRVDFAKRQVFVAQVEVHLTPIEYKLLTELIRHAGKVLTHRHLLMVVWGPHHEMENHYLRIYVRQLRQKIEAEPARPKYLLTETGIGYRLQV